MPSKNRKSQTNRRKKHEPGLRRDYGPNLVLLVLALVLVGLAVVYSSSSHFSDIRTGDPATYFIRQLEKAVAGIVIMLVVSRIDYRKLIPFAKPALWFSAGLLLFLLLVPEESSLVGGPIFKDTPLEGKKRWLFLGGFSFQPSEIAKFSVILWCAHTAVRKARDVEHFTKGVLPFLLAMGGVSFLVVFEPDLSQAFLITISVLLILYLAGSRKRHLAAVVITGVLLFALFCRLEPYRWERVKVHVGISDSPAAQKYTYQGEQSKIAIGSGGLTGVGWGASRQKMMYLPEAYKDFIFSIVGEEFGFLGAGLLVAAYCYFAALGLRIARAAKDRFGYYLSLGIVVTIVLGALINMMVVTVLVPSTGITLPFISYGGSSLIVSLASVGVLRNIARVSAGKVRRSHEGGNIL